METDLMWRGDDMKPTLTVFDVRDEAQGYENCPQVKTQTLKTGELETKQSFQHFCRRCHSASAALTCRRALAAYVIMTAENAPNFRALLKTSVEWGRRRDEEFRGTKTNSYVKGFQFYRCAGSRTSADSTTSPPPPWTEETPHSGVWLPSCPCQTESGTNIQSRVFLQRI